jgi:molecular chaperone DnaK
VQVLSTGGDPQLGGDDWDAKLMDFIAKKHLIPHGVNTNAPAIRARLRAVARSAKEHLSTAPSVSLQVPIGGKHGKGVQFVLHRTLLEDITADLFRRCREPVEQACWQAGVDLGAFYDARERSNRRLGLKGGAAHYPTHGSNGEDPVVEHISTSRQPVSIVRSSSSPMLRFLCRFIALLQVVLSSL